MRKFIAVVRLEFEAESFADAEGQVLKTASDAFNTSKGKYPKRFDTLTIMKGEKL